MKKSTFFKLFFLTILFINCKKAVVNNPVIIPTKPLEVVKEPVIDGSKFLKTKGNLILDPAGKQVLLRGVAFGNDVWNELIISKTHHDEQDFLRLKEMNMNAVRFYIGYDYFENPGNPYTYKQSGWDWIDQNVAWAKKHGIYLILNMHRPQGGYQSQGKGDALWETPENQNRVAALWKTIAKKYADEPQIIGFGLINEPVPTKSIVQWNSLAQKIIDEIRIVDKHHILFVESAIFVKGNVPRDSNFNFPIVTDNNLVYEFHNYEPMSYTHQLFDWSNLGEGGKYPDENLISYSDAVWYTGAFNGSNFSKSTSDWEQYEGEKFSIKDPKIKLGMIALVGSKGGSGKVYFDDIVIKEYDPSGKFTKDVLINDLEKTTSGGWAFWASNGVGKATLTQGSGRNNGSAMVLEGATADCNTSSYGSVFVAKQGYAYQISGWMKAENLAAGAECKIRIDFLNTPNPISFRNKQYLEDTFRPISDWSKYKNVPIYLGEFGAGAPCFKNGKGGVNYVSDMLDILKANNINFTYHAYHEDSFGLYFGYNSTLPNPNNSNVELINLFKEKLK